jgi:hypothetical protein
VVVVLRNLVAIRGKVVAVLRNVVVVLRKVDIADIAQAGVVVLR